MREFFRELIGIFYPPRCVVCDGLLEPGEKIHPGCVQFLYPVGKEVCCRCGRPVRRKEEEYCCDCKKVQHVFRQGKALFLYQGKIKESMYRFKYGNRREYGQVFAGYAANAWGDWIARCGIELIVPIPMYRKKKRRRGYNQAECFARALSERTKVPWEKNALLRIRDTVPQKTLKPIERENNLKNAFFANRNMIRYKKILIVDDIYTTGSTVDEAAEELYRKGAAEVYFLSICIGKGA